MKQWGIIIVVLMASCVWNLGFGVGKLLHVKKDDGSLINFYPAGMSADGNTSVGKIRIDNQWEAARWNPNHPASRFKILTPKEGETSTGSAAHDVSADGNIIVGAGSWVNADYNYPKIWIDDTVVDYTVDFGGSEYLEAVAYAISDDGHIIATRDIIQSPYFASWNIPFTHRWDISTTTPPDYIPNMRPAASDFIQMPMYEPPQIIPGSEYTGSRSMGISGNGSVIVGISEIHTSPVAVRWFNDQDSGWSIGTFEPWDKNRGSSAVAASYDGKIVVGNSSFNVGTEADPQWEWRGFAWPFESRKIRVWGIDEYDVFYANSTEATSVTKVAAGSGHTFGLLSTGEVVAWAWNDDPELQPPSGLEEVIEIDAGYEHVIALKQDKTVVAWGYNDYHQTDVPDGLTNVKAIAAGQYHNLALKEDGTVVAWGWNNDGQTDVPGDLGPVSYITAGYGHSLALLEDGSLRGWGLNDNGQTDDPGGLENLVAIEAGYYHNLSLDSSGAVFAWGLNDWGQADWWYIEDPVIDISAGHQHSIVLYDDGVIDVYGHYNQADNIPSGLSVVMDVAAGEQHSVVLDANGIMMLDRLPSDETIDIHTYTHVTGISGDGKMIVGMSGVNSTSESNAVYWDETGAIHRFEDLLDNISHTGWEFNSISAINHDGSSMIGFGNYEGNTNQVWHLNKAYDDGYSDSDDIGGDWQEHSIMGVFWRAGKSHVWHNQHGWQKMTKGRHEIRLFDYGSDSWLWTSEADYPFMYRYGTNPGWVFYDEGGSPGQRVFYHFGQDKWMTEIELAGQL